MKSATRAFIYKWTEHTAGMWYVGSRTKIGCHPGDGYICSSPTVKSLIQSNSSNWSREVLIIGDSLYVRNLESLYLTLICAAQDSMSYNRSNGGGKFYATPESSTKSGLAQRGKLVSADTCKNQSTSLRKRYEDPILRKKIADSLRNVKHSADRCKKQGNAQKQRFLDVEEREKIACKVEQRWLDPLYRKKQLKTWIVLIPDMSEVVVDDLKQYCKIHLINYHSLFNTLNRSPIQSGLNKGYMLKEPSWKQE